ncbi:alpha/beta fold hydrolase [Oryzobacter sp. R7]|uniref:alpha/beta fold hydrolase n=1 Tax=Oryzobacter faecalis TaxID=3388656 RepID=UPI00398D01B4
MPGLGLDARSWSRVWPYLDGPSTAVTLPTMGRAASTLDDLRPEALAVRLVEQLPPSGPLVLVGHSASCQVVGEARRDDRVVGVVLVGPTTARWIASWPAIVGRWSLTAVHEHLWEIPLVGPQYLRTGLWTMARGMDRIRHHRLDRALAVGGVPMAVVRGGHDRIADAAWCRHLAATCVDGSVTTVPGAGHMVPLTHPAAVATVVEEMRRRVAVTVRGFDGGDPGQRRKRGAHP